MLAPGSGGLTQASETEHADCRSQERETARRRNRRPRPAPRDAARYARQGRKVAVDLDLVPADYSIEEEGPDFERRKIGRVGQQCCPRESRAIGVLQGQADVEGVGSGRVSGENGVEVVAREIVRYTDVEQIRSGERIAANVCSQTAGGGSIGPAVGRGIPIGGVGLEGEATRKGRPEGDGAAKGVARIEE